MRLFVNILFIFEFYTFIH